MHFFSSLAVVGTLAASVIAAPAPPHVMHEKRTYTPKVWEKRDKIHGSSVLPMRIGLTQSNLEHGHDKLMELSDPLSPKYGQHWTVEEVTDFFAPSESTVDTVREWLESAGIAAERVSQSVNKQWLQFDAHVREVEDLLRTEYYRFEHTPTGKSNIACDEYHVPQHVQAHVDYITPGVKLFTLGSKAPNKESIEKRTFGVTSGSRKTLQPPLLKALPAPLETILEDALLEAICDVAIIPECIKRMYNVTDPSAPVNPNNQLGIFEDLDDMYSQTDLNEFFLTLAPNIPQGTHPKLDSIDGATAPAAVTSAGPESDLDFQISYPLIYPQNTILYQTDDDLYEANYTYDGFFNNFLDAIDGSYCTFSAYGETGNSPLDPPYPDNRPGGYDHPLQCGVYKPTNVISISYGGQEADLPMSYQQRQCAEFMKLGMQGITIVVASGDSGVAGPAGDDSADGCLGGGKIFSPDFPATCPYLTSAGATYLPPGANVNTDSETAVTRFPSGGGFSNIYPIPSYQKAAVEYYFANHNPPYPYYESTYNSSFGANGGIYNRIGRGYPDVSAIGDNVVIFNMGAPTLIGGTSAAAPCFASIINRIDEERIKVGKSTVGFINPTLYANPKAFHDITVGNNSGCGTAGFYAGTGWDPLTGLGTPNYPALLAVFMALP